jgi:hypothetical protein
LKNPDSEAQFSFGSRVPLEVRFPDQKGGLGM